MQVMNLSAVQTVSPGRYDLTRLTTQNKFLAYVVQNKQVMYDWDSITSSPTPTVSWRITPTR
jgi:hypothetical protein